MCIKPFIEACDIDQNNIINVQEWCTCFENTDRPCIALKRALKMTKSYVPDCDNDGFYNPTQCHSTGVCWCVDKHGVEFANTRSRNNKLNCGKTEFVSLPAAVLMPFISQNTY
jgi:sparc/osteonectin/cwcv/kazal-like domain-containing proteoglycan (testican)